MRNLLYQLAKLLGDLSAIVNGRVGRRVHNRIVGRASARVLRRIWK